MAIRQVARMGHPVLRKVAEVVTDPGDPEIARLAGDMRDTIENLGAAGIAAPQVYVSKRVVVFRVPASRIPPGIKLKPIPWTTMINPVVKPLTEKKELIWERCLSLPNMHGKVPRHTEIKVVYHTTEGREAQIDAENWLAMLLQHEVDHLDGILYPMRMVDLSLLAFNSDPGALAEEAAKTPDLDPALRALVNAWPTREKWVG
ncbi:MAG: peptide deformylase [Alphaproteobacteria bacterium]|nr:peptide deformylase [Alphaproteobacteria bacterium]